ncbi:hypothetical protein Glo7428_3422 [Gloeocapsa sp. PCC 7428]|uniref:esterase/lipase family protein n=1 Tax=Gloeocapsa sp. PCC 7428 TaxID=1173026 RepID=UPI0002A60039|nr:alpha/beta fold hydrolase [Gloeocapsa sp. PCC 7428]AFZ31900.1 hypothetical protein Glo7428_3422 [Gloeocapsa sp. PCC 7428]
MNVMSIRNPVLLLHGRISSHLQMSKLADYLSHLGWHTYSLSFEPSTGELGLEHWARQIEDYISRNFSLEQPIDIVGFSMGGLAGRYYLQCLGGVNRVQRFISISTPHRGTWTAYLLSHIGCRQMRPNSPFLKMLDRHIECLASVSCTTIWTFFDVVILPASSSILPIGNSVQIPVIWHDCMPFSNRVMQVVAEALIQEPS